MIRPLTLLSVIAAAGAGLHVYNTKHAVFMLDRELRTIAHGVQEAETRTQALQAEWAWATEQERLRALAQRHLALEPMQPAQFVRFAEAERRLPPPEAHSGPVALFAPGETPAAESRTRIALLSPGPATAGRASPATVPPAPAATTPVLTAVAQAALAAAAAKPLPLPAPAAPDAPPVVTRTAVALPPLPAVVRAASAAEPRQAEARAPEPRPAAISAVAVRPAPPAPAPQQQRPVAAPPRPAPEPPAPAAAPRPQAPAPVAVASVASPRPTAQVAVASVAPPRVSEAAATSLGSFGPSLGGSALGSARAALPPPVAFGSAASGGASFR